ncbi:MAG: hypothetical protein K6E62_03160, partial [Lachnospiraceae bacterium]|nr:hypothetical protein [Lachnospiraceae bacterium]
LDANTSQELLEKIAATCTTPIAFDAVSISKVARCANILDKLFIFKPNLYEAAALYEALNGRDVALNNPDDALNGRDDPDYTPSDKTGSDPDSDGIAADKTSSDGDPPDSSAGHPADLSSRVRCQACLYAAFLRSRGVKNVMISLGKDGVYYENEDYSGIMPSMVRDIANTSGCGDAFLAGAVRGYLDNGSLEAMARYGSAASAICAAHDETVSPELDITKINEILKEHEHPV